MLDVESIRKDFPIYHKEGAKLVYLDSASTTQKPRVVINSVKAYYESYAANIHRALYAIGEKATNEYESVRGKIKKFLNVPDSHAIIFTKGATESINLIAYAWGLSNLNQNDTILITEMEHHSNLVPWQLIAKKTGAALDYIPITAQGEFDTNSIDSKLNSKTKLVSLSHQSNVFGTINSINDIINKAKSIDAITVVDGAQAVPHLRVDIENIDCDFYVFSAHKMLGPTGAGVLIGRKDILNEMDPFMGGGEMINNVTMDESTWNDVPWKFEAGTPNIAQVIGLGSAVDYIETIGIKNIHLHEQELLKYTLEAFSSIKSIKTYGNPTKRGAVIPFNVEGVHPHDLAKFLDTDNICVRAGHHCAQPIMKKLNVNSTARVSFYLYNDKSDINKLLESIDKTIKIFA